MKHLILLFILPFALYAQIIFHNGKIYTQNPEQPWAEAIVIEGSSIVFVGSSSEALKYRQSASNVIDLEGAFAMPGLIDSHTHTAIASVLLKEGVNLLGSKGRTEAFERIAAYAASHPDASVITGFGFYPYMFGPNGPTASQLDRIVPDRAAFLIANNGHTAWANTPALKRLGITKETPDPQPGIHYYMRDEAGNPTGFLVEGCALWPHAAALGIGTEQSYHNALKTLLPILAAQGITSVFDAGAPASEAHAFNALIRLEKENALPVRYFGSHYILSHLDASKAAENFENLRQRFNTPLFRVSSVKFVNDNSDDDNFAIQFDTQTLQPFMEKLLVHDIDAMVHTSADTSVHTTLDAIERARKKFPHSKSRLTLSHLNMVRESDFIRLKALDVIANIQPFNAKGGGYYEYRYMLYEDAWADKLVRFKTFFDHGIVVSASSDFPACDTDLSACSPFHHMEIGMTRQKVASPDDAPVLASKEERLSLEQMLQAYTINGAYQLHQEDAIGSLKVGKKADLILLNHNPFELSPKEIHTIEVKLTVLNGSIVYRKDTR